MKCYYHPDRDAVSSCQKCGKYLCKECADKYSPCLCNECYNILRQEEKNELIESKKPFIKSIILGVVFFIVSMIIVSASGGMKEAGWFPFVAFFIPFGWKYANLLGLTWFFNINAAGCLLMCFVYAFRATVAVICGIPCFIIALIKLKKISDAARSIEIENISPSKEAQEDLN